MGLNPIVHAPVAVTEIDLELVKDPKVVGLFGPKPRDLCFLGENPTFQLVDLLTPVLLAPIPTLEHVFDCIGRVGQNPYPCRMDWNVSKTAAGSQTLTLTDLGSIPIPSLILKTGKHRSLTGNGKDRGCNHGIKERTLSPNHE